MLFLRGILCLLLVLAAFSVFSIKAPGGRKAMSGLANAAVASFLVEAIFKYILGDFAGIPFFAEAGTLAGSMGGPAAAILVGLALGTEPILAVSSGIAVAGFGILPGFLAGYLLHYIWKPIEKRLPDAIRLLIGALFAAAAAYGIACLSDPAVTKLIAIVADALELATEQSPVIMGLILGGIIKIVCTSPLSSMALTAMMGLTGLPMGIAAIACFGGSFTNGIIFSRLRIGNRNQVVAVMLEPLTQADIITRNPIPIYVSNFFGGGLSGIAAAVLGIINNAPGTASPIPGMLAPFAFNDTPRVLLALLLAALGGTLSGFVFSQIFKKSGHSTDFRPERTGLPNRD